MMRQRTSRGRQDGRRVLPVVEALEERCLPACNFVVQGSTLFIVGPTTPKGDGQMIQIMDNGGSDKNNVTASCQTATAATATANTIGSSGVPIFQPDVPIATVEVVTGKGADHVEYDLTNPLMTARSVSASLGRGKDSFMANLKGGLGDGSSLALNVDGGAGPDTLTASLGAGLGHNSRLAIHFRGRGGKNTLSVTADPHADVAAGAALTVDLKGNGTSDTISSTYSGRLDGTYEVHERGGNGRNRLSADIRLAMGSTGQLLPSSVIGGPGNDQLTFTVENPDTVPANNEIVDGRGGINTCTRTDNVVVLHCEHDTVVGAA
jgi:hypothetical protein